LTAAAALAARPAGECFGGEDEEETLGGAAGISWSTLLLFPPSFPARVWPLVTRLTTSSYDGTEDALLLLLEAVLVLVLRIGLGGPDESLEDEEE